jgi:hypothetical protein
MYDFIHAHKSYRYLLGVGVGVGLGFEMVQGKEQEQIGSPYNEISHTISGSDYDCCTVDKRSWNHGSYFQTIIKP